MNTRRISAALPIRAVLAVILGVGTYSVTYAQAPPTGPTPATAEVVGIVDSPCPPPLEMPAMLRKALENPNPAAAMAAMGPAATPPPTAVFIGDSITEGRARVDGEFFAANNFVGRGISGQTSAQNLLRFQQDVIALHPKVVHIMIGTNDIAGNTGPTSYQAIQNNIAAVVALARVNRIRVVLATIPAGDLPWRRGMNPAPKIAVMNAWIREYVQREQLTLADYHALLATTDGGLNNDWSTDGVHPNAAGYQRMYPVAHAAVQAALRRRR